MPRSSDIALFSCQFSANHDPIESCGRGALRCSFALHIALIATVLLLLSSVSVSAQTVTATLPAGIDPIAMAVNPVTNKIYVTNFGTSAGSADGSVTVIDGATNSTMTVVAGSANPSAIAVNPLTNQIYVANSGNGTVGVISGETGETLGISVGSYPNAIAINPVTNKIYVTNRDSNNLTVIDGATNTTISITVGTAPSSLAVDPFTNKIYIANTGSDDLTIVDGATNIAANLSLGSTPSAIAVNAATNKIYVAMMGNPVSNAGSLAVVDGITNTLSTVNVGVAPHAVAVNSVTNQVYVVDSGSSDLTVVDGSTLNTTPVPVGHTPMGISVNPLTNSIYVTNSVDGTVTVIDETTNHTVTLAVGSGPGSIAVNPITNRVYAGNAGANSNSVTVIDGAANKFTAVSVGNSPGGLIVDPLTNKVFFKIETGVAVLDGNSLNSGEFPSSANASGFAVNPATGKFYISDSADSTLTVYDELGFTSTTIPFVLNPAQFNINAVTNRAYLTSFDSNTMMVIDLATYNNVSIPITAQGLFSVMADINPVTNKIYISNLSGYVVTEIDGSANSVANVPLGLFPAGLAINPVTNKVYVANEGLYEISVIDGATHEKQQVAETGRFPQAVAVNPLTNKVYVTTGEGIAILDGATNQSIAFLRTPLQSTVGTPGQIAVDLAKNKIYVPYRGNFQQSFHDSSLIVIDGETNTATKIVIGTGPDSVVVNPVTNQVFVANSLDGTVSVIDDRSKIASPIVAQIQPLENNTANSPTPQFTILASDSIPGAKLTNVYYQLDTWQGNWLPAASQGGNSFTATLAALLPGFHTIYAFATDGQDATPTNGGSASALVTSNIAAYYFLVVPAVPPPANDFTGSFDTFNQRVAPGQQAVYNLTITPINSFNSDVTLTASNLPTGTTLTFAPSIIQGGSGTTAITVVTTSGTPPGSYDIQLTATSGLLVHSTAITLNVGADGDFIGSFDRSAATVRPGDSTNFTLTLKPLEGFNANVSFSVAGLPSGVSATFSPTTIAGGSGQTVLTITTTAAAAKGTFPFSVVASTPGLTHSTTLNLLVGAPDFTASITPSFQAVSVGGSAQYIINAHTIGTVPFGQCLRPLVTGLPVGVTASLNPPTINPDQNGSAVLTLQTRSYTPQGGYYPFVSIDGSSGQSHSSYISLAVSAPPTTGDFSGSFANTSATAAPNSPATYVLNLTPSGGFDGNVALTVSGLPDDATGSFSPSVLAGGSGTSTLTVAVDTGTPAGVYNFTVTASSGSTVIRTTTLTLLVGVTDFTGTITPSTQTVSAGATTQFTVSLQSLGNNFSGSLVSLYATNLPPGVTASFSQNPLFPFSGNNSVLSLTTTSATPPGTYSLVITAVSGSDSHARTLTLNVTPTLGSVSQTGSMTVTRYQPTATLLTSGKVLVAGGSSQPYPFYLQQLSSTELYDPATGTFSISAGMGVSRAGHTATLLNNGKVLIIGGWDNTSPQPLTQSSAELYDPSTGTFTFTGAMNAARANHTATLLPDGTVLIAGGENAGPFSSSLASAEIYDPATGIFTLTGSMSMDRLYGSATLLNNGKVLIAGGERLFFAPSSEAELYDPASRTFTVTGNMNSSHAGHTATLLNSGKVLLVGGGSATNELYDPSTGAFSTTGNLNYARSSQAATELNNGMVFVVGGLSNDTRIPLANGELYDAQAGNFRNGVTLIAARSYHTETLLNNGSVLIAGGPGPTPSAELFKPVTFAPPGLVSISITPATPVLAAGSSLRLTATGTFSDGTTQTLSSVTWSSLNSAVATITNDASNLGAAYATASGSTTIQACTGSICGSTILTVP